MILQLLSCADESTPMQTNIPKFKSVAAKVDGDIVTLSAELEYEADIVSDCGFMFGKYEKSLKKYPAALIGKNCSLILDDLKYETKYLFRAYAGNGKNVVYSDIVVVQTPPNPAEQPDRPSVPSTPSPPSTPDSFDYEIDMSHVDAYWQFSKVTEVSVKDWSWISGSGPAYMYYYFLFSDNTSLSPRSKAITLTRDDKEYYVKVTQHAYLDTISFKCSKTKDICVGVWDRNSDGEISYEEAALASEIQIESFAGKDLDSFHEFRHFSCAQGGFGILDYLFEGSSLKSIVLPYSGAALGKGMFRNCKELEFVYTHFRHVEEETFMNCVSLKEVEASIVGERAYMGCTSLETVIQFRPCVPAMAFKGCTNLRTFEFDWYDLAFYDDRVIGDEAFYNCSSLTEIDVPREITSVGPRAFYGCESLSKICFYSSVPPTLGEDAIENANPDMKIIVPSPLVNVYKLNWPDLAQNIITGD